MTTSPPSPIQIQIRRNLADVPSKKNTDEERIESRIRRSCMSHGLIVVLGDW